MIIKLISEWEEASGLEANRVRSNQEISSVGGFSVDYNY